MCGVPFRSLCSSLEAQFVHAILGIPLFGHTLAKRPDPESFSLSVFNFQSSLLKGQSHLCNAVGHVSGDGPLSRAGPSWHSYSPEVTPLQSMRKKSQRSTFKLS